MKLKKTLTGVALAVSTAVLPQTTKANPENSTNTTAKVSTVAKAEKVSIPDWIPTTPDGQFDEKAAREQANLLWKEHGKPIQQFSDDIKAGVPEKVAFAKFAHQLAKGDKEKEKLILSLSKSVKEARKEMDGDMRVPAWGKVMGCAEVFLLGLLFMGIIVRDTKKDSKAESIALSIGMLVTVGSTAFSIIGSNIDSLENLYQKKGFVEIQRAMYDTYKQLGSNLDLQQKGETKDYTIVDMPTAKKMIEMQQTKSNN